MHRRNLADELIDKFHATFTDYGLHQSPIHENRISCVPEFDRAIVCRSRNDTTEKAPTLDRDNELS